MFLFFFLTQPYAKQIKDTTEGGARAGTFVGGGGGWHGWGEASLISSFF